MRPWIIVLAMTVLFGIVTTMRESRYSRELASLRSDLESLRETISTTTETSTESRSYPVRRAQQRREQTPGTSEADQTLGFAMEQPASTFQSTSSPTSQVPAGQQIAALESRVQKLQKILTQVERGPSVPEYNPNLPEQPPVPDQTVPSASPLRKRGWGQEQIVGAPDTASAGDLPTAWASFQPDGGAEWLAAGFDQAVDLAEVRIRESHNPGAITKVTAVVDGQEVILWEGEASRGQGLRDFTVPVNGNVKANSVVVHLDTAKVPGWNEIDAVEIVGRDGSRQWAISATASSTYAEPQLSKANQ